jgi:hypothetical protein
MNQNPKIPSKNRYNKSSAVKKNGQAYMIVRAHYGDSYDLDFVIAALPPSHLA